MTVRMIQVGTGGWGGWWCEHLLPAAVAAGLVEVVAAVDVDEHALETARRHLALPPDRCHTSVEQAFAEVEADFCTVVVPPHAHESVVDAALAHGLDVLSEKPIADTLEGSLRIADKVTRAGRRMGVTMSQRFEAGPATLREELRSGRFGRTSHLGLRFSANLRRYGSWGAFRHAMPDPMLVDGAVHHLDLLADLAGGTCTRLYAETWNAPWGEYAGDSSAIVTLAFDNGARAVYEATLTSAAGLNDWGLEQVRAETERAAFELDHRRLVRYDHAPAGPSAWPPARDPAAVAPLARGTFGHRWLLEQFVSWVQGGEPMATRVAANVRSAALVFAAVESARTGRVVEVPQFLEQARARLATSEPVG